MRLSTRRFAILAALLGLMALAIACGRRSASPIVARVGDAVLTLDDIRSSIPAEYRDRITREQNIAYVKQWIDTELLYQEALKRRLLREPAIRSRLESMKRELLSAELLSRQQASAAPLSDSTVLRYYEANRETFARPHEVVRCLQIVVDKYAQASALRAQVTPENFLALAEQSSLLPPEDPRSVPYMAPDDLPAPVAAALAGLRVGGTTQPVKVGERFSIVHLLDRQPAGSTATLDEVRDRIVDRLTAQIQKEEIDHVLSSLRMKTEVTFNFDAIPGKPPAPDSTKKTGHTL
jgi:parvulin-like peptidyl-prolyl isomerase